MYPSQRRPQKGGGCQRVSSHLRPQTYPRKALSSALRTPGPTRNNPVRQVSCSIEHRTSQPPAVQDCFPPHHSHPPTHPRHVCVDALRQPGLSPHHGVLTEDGTNFCMPVPPTPWTPLDYLLTVLPSASGKCRRCGDQSWTGESDARLTVSEKFICLSFCLSSWAVFRILY